MKKPTDGLNTAWLEQFVSGTSQEAKAPAFRPTQSPSERKAAETTRVFREVTDAAADQRRNAAAKLKAARLAKEADQQALSVQKSAKLRKGKKPEA